MRYDKSDWLQWSMLLVTNGSITCQRYITYEAILQYSEKVIRDRQGEPSMEQSKRLTVSTTSDPRRAKTSWAKTISCRTVNDRLKTYQIRISS